MKLINATHMQAGYTLGMNSDGRELLVIAIKGTFTFPEPGEEPQLAEKQISLVEADIFSGAAGFSAPLCEVDYVPFKPRCDVLLNGSAYSPDEKPVKVVPVKLSVGDMTKEFNVIGDRVWSVNGLDFTQSDPVPFTSMPISYDLAFGGTDVKHPDQTKHSAYMLNPVGRGYHMQLDRELFDGAPLPNTEELGASVTQPAGKYRPMAFGPIGRGWEPRFILGGTYDQNWVDNVFPFLPADFNDAYYQCSPVDQRVNYLQGGERVELINLTPQGHIEFKIPVVKVPVVFFLKKGGRHETEGVADTLLLEPDQNRFSITWRINLPLKKNIFEVSEVLAGKMSRAWWRARELGKAYYPSLEVLAHEKRMIEDEAQGK